ncbi:MULTISPECIES: TRAP transporter substrate-binding protein [Bacillaceae]|uniref:Tripartite ATP-independent transporter DctP family solute receptor n=1 Tax=Peribacillus huizhouensis TaxID=1501239 RepID=A0ABR6CQV0_9BACI|nr:MULTISPECIES: TRAP transporter substrate-binding protein [Bacillaceae]MBA9027413.1 tripartite ATP-independent transporter DctP family solute receptor [Peribacillus huizhouensis]
MSKKFLSLFMILTLITSILAACGTSGEKASGGGKSSGDARIIRAGIGLNDKHPQYLGLLKFKEIVEKETNGAIKVETYHSSQLGDDRAMMEALQLGTQQMTIPSTAPIANFIPEYSVYDIPFMFPSEEVADKVLLESDIAKELLEKLPDQGMVGLAYWENGFRDLTNNKVAVSNVGDFKNLKIRTMENQLHLEAFKALGANPTPMAFAELFTAMQQGTIDGQENPIATIYLQKYNEVQKHVSLTHHVYSPFVVLLSKIFWDESSKEEQDILVKAAKEAGDYSRKLNREANSTYIAELEQEGMTVTEITPEAREEMKAITDPVVEKFSDKIGKDTIDRMRKAVEEAGK